MRVRALQLVPVLAASRRAARPRGGNSFAVDRRAVYIVTDAALYRFGARRGRPRTIWRRGYRNTGVQKPGQTQAGSGRRRR